MTTYAELSNEEVIELATTVKIITNMLEMEHSVESSFIFFREYSAKEIEFEVSLDTEESNVFLLHFLW